jgi:hypothetical protein
VNVRLVVIGLIVVIVAALVALAVGGGFFGPT